MNFLFSWTFPTATFLFTRFIIFDFIVHSFIPQFIHPLTHPAFLFVKKYHYRGQGAIHYSCGFIGFSLAQPSTLGAMKMEPVNREFSVSSHHTHTHTETLLPFLPLSPSLFSNKMKVNMYKIVRKYIITEIL